MLTGRKGKVKWELWSAGCGERCVMEYDEYGNRRVVAWMKTKRHTVKDKTGWHTRVTWKSFRSRWLHELGEFKSDNAAFRDYVKNMGGKVTPDRAT